MLPGEAFPPRTRTPGDVGSHFATCQTINIVRRYGWSIGLAAEHHSCPLGLVALGFKPNVEYLQEGHACMGMYTESLEAGARMEAAVPKFEVGATPVCLPRPYGIIRLSLLMWWWSLAIPRR